VEGFQLIPHVIEDDPSIGHHPVHVEEEQPYFLSLRMQALFCLVHSVFRAKNYGASTGKEQRAECKALCF
jgi:hypothetical protein